MKNTILPVLAVALLSSVGQAFAFCTPGTVEVCYLNGKQGTRTCGSNGLFGPCQVPQPPPTTVSGLVLPKYKILTVIYAPPGTQGGGSTSSVSYGQGSSTGTSSSTGSSFKESYSVSASAEAGFLGTGGSVGASFSWSRSSSNSEAIDFKKTANLAINHRGPAVNGIDHDRDQIWLWLNPRLKFFLDTSSAIWTFDNSESMDVLYVYVGHLKDPSLMPADVARRLQARGITTTDYAEILEADPYAYATPPIDSGRYQQLLTTFPYEPPYGPNDPVPTLSFTAAYTDTRTSSNTSTKEYSTGLNVSGSIGFTDKFKTLIKTESEWTWGDTVGYSSSDGTTESAAVTVGGPSYGYTGPTNMAVYYDTLYRTFLFVPVDAALRPAFSGALSSRSKQNLAGREVQLVADGLTYRTFTNAKGEYRFYGNIVRPSVVQSVTAKTYLRPEQRTASIALP